MKSLMLESLLYWTEDLTDEDREELKLKDKPKGELNVHFGK